MLPDLVRHELWYVLLTYNPEIYQIVKMDFELTGEYLPYQLSISGSVREITWLMMALPWSLPVKIPGDLRTLYEKARWLLLP